MKKLAVLLAFMLLPIAVQAMNLDEAYLRALRVHAGTYHSDWKQYVDISRKLWCLPNYYDPTRMGENLTSSYDSILKELEENYLTRDTYERFNIRVHYQNELGRRYGARLNVYNEEAWWCGIYDAYLGSNRVRFYGNEAKRYFYYYSEPNYYPERYYPDRSYTVERRYTTEQHQYSTEQRQYTTERYYTDRAYPAERSYPENYYYANRLYR